MKNYLLTVIGSFESEKLCNDMVMALTPIVDSPNLKYSYSRGALMCHFESEVSKEEIYDYVIGVFYGISSTFILTELHDNMTLHLPEELKEHLLKLDDVLEEGVNIFNMNNVKKNIGFDEMEDDEDFVALILEHAPNIVKRPSLDQILDKMLAKGYESLSQFEKDMLTHYSKN